MGTQLVDVIELSQFELSELIHHPSQLPLQCGLHTVVVDGLFPDLDNARALLQLFGRLKKKKSYVYSLAKLPRYLCLYLRIQTTNLWNILHLHHLTILIMLVLRASLSLFLRSTIASSDDITMCSGAVSCSGGARYWGVVLLLLLGSTSFEVSVTAISIFTCFPLFSLSPPSNPVF